MIRTSEPAKRMSAADAVRAYKGLAETERVFRGMSGVANHVRPRSTPVYIVQSLPAMSNQSGWRTTTAVSKKTL